MRHVLPIGGSALIAAVLALTASSSLARTSYQTAFNDLYGVGGTRLGDCGVCHLDFGGGGPGNAYYDDWAAAGGPVSPVMAFLLTEKLDSDGDGTPNLTEILSLFHPGYGCDTYGDALNAPADLADYVNPADIGCGPAPAPQIDVSPVSLDFGSVEVAMTASETVWARNLGEADLTVMTAILSASSEYAVDGPTTPFVIAPGGEAQWTITYAPGDEGTDAGTFAISSDDPVVSGVSVDISGQGFANASAPLDLDIVRLHVTRRVRLEQNHAVKITATIENESAVDGETRPATLQATQNGVVVYSETQEVSDDVGHGRARVAFGPYTPSGAGNLEWTLQIEDDDLDVDLATATTLVLSSSKMGGANLTGADLRGEVLHGVDLTGADVSGADLRGCDLSYATGLALMRFDSSTQYSSSTDFTGTGFDPQRAGWTLVDDDAVPIEASFGQVKALFDTP